VGSHARSGAARHSQHRSGDRFGGTDRCGRPRSLALGGKASLPRIASPTLAAAFIDPATAWLEAHGAPVALGRRLRSIETAGDRVTALDWGAGPEPVAADEAVVLAVPSWVAKGLLPTSACPTRSIRSSTPISRSRRRRAPLMLGLLGATGQWLFAFEDRISVTVSADDIVDHDREELAYRFWDEIQRAYGFAAPMPAWQIVKEKRATFSATPEQDAKRPPARTRWRNLFLAGDWTATGLPATIEGALRSGETAARTVLARRNARGTSMTDPITAPENLETVDLAVDRAANAMVEAQRPDGHWVSNWKPIARFRPNTCSCAISSANPTISNSKPRSAAICAGSSRRNTTAGACSTAAPSIFGQRQSLLRAQDDRRRHQCAAHGARARRSAAGGAAAVNVFTRIQLALFGAGSWDAVPTMPPELILLPRWFPIHLRR
jgi:hypothetical protein